MSYSNFKFSGYNKFELVGYSWHCEDPKAIVIIIHGMSEHAARYDDFSNFLTTNGLSVYASDLRGHGKTAETPENVGLFAMENGWGKVIQDQRALISYVESKSDLPIFILGHSMGSFIARSVSFSGENRIAGYLLSATAGDPGFLGRAGKIIASVNSKWMGKKNRSKLLDKLAFGDFNKKIENPNTVKDWLSRDPEIVQKYVNDPFCMQVFMSQFFTDLLEGILSINYTTNIQNMARVPYLLFAGNMDPVGEYGKGVEKVHRMMLNTKHDVELNMYDGGRHEMLNEINKEEVYHDILNWMNNKLI